MKANNIQPRMTLSESIRFYFNYVKNARKTKHQPVSFFRYRAGRI